MTVTVVGAGVAGLVCAVELASRGVSVEVIEQSSSLEDNTCSWYAGGMLAPRCEGETAEDSVVQMGLPAIEWWERHFDKVERRGTLVVSQPRDTAELKRFARRTKGHVWLDDPQISELETDISGRFNTALFFAEEAHLNPREALIALHQRLAELDVPVLYGVSMSKQALPSGTVVDCRGLAAKDKLVDLRGVRGEMLLLRSDEINLSRTVRMLHPRFPVYIVPHGAGLYMIGATMIESDSYASMSARSAMELLGAAVALHPAFGEAEIVEMGVGVRPAFPDNIPDVRHEDNVYYVNGLYRHGYLLAPAMAMKVANMITGVGHNSKVQDEDFRQWKAN